MRLLKRVAMWCAKIVAGGFALAIICLAASILLLVAALPVALAGYVFGLGFWLAFVSLPI